MVGSDRQAAAPVKTSPVSAPAANEAHEAAEEGGYVLRTKPMRTATTPMNATATPSRTDGRRAMTSAIQDAPVRGTSSVSQDRRITGERGQAVGSCACVKTE